MPEMFQGGQRKMNTIHTIRTGIFGVNTYIVDLGNKKCFVVDPAACSLSGDRGKITSWLLEKKMDCVAVVLTHTHFDHIMGIDQIKKQFPQALICVHKEEFSELSSCPGIMNHSLLDFFGLEEVENQLREQPAGEVALTANQTLGKMFQGGQSKNSDSETVEALDKWAVLHTPGHSPGSICLYNKSEGLLISGDTLFDGGYGRTDMYGGDEGVLMHSLNYLRENIPSGTKVYPGHDNFGFSL